VVFPHLATQGFTPVYDEILKLCSPSASWWSSRSVENTLTGDYSLNTTVRFNEDQILGEFDKRKWQMERKFSGGMNLSLDYLDVIPAIQTKGVEGKICDGSEFGN
jgi:hypothetical protein